MAWSTIPAWVAGNALTAAELNTYVRDNLNALTTWETYSPTLDNWGLGNGTLNGWFIYAGDLVHYEIQFLVGSTTTFTGGPIFSLPVFPAIGVFDPPVGIAHMVDASSSARAMWHAWGGTDGGARLRDNSGTNPNPTTPWTWAAGDAIVISGTYRGA